ncbi:hypothetical protein [Spirosoma jeollabukense]
MTPTKIKKKTKKSLPLDHRYNFTWPHYRALRQLYTDGQTNLKITSNGFIKQRLISGKAWVQPKLHAAEGYYIPEYLRSEYNTWYEENYKERINQFQQFFCKHDIPDEGTHPYRSEDIDSLMAIAALKEDILRDFETYSLNSFSNQFFKNKGAKYLGDHESLKKAVKAILKTDRTFPGENPKDNQWRLAIECDEAEVLVLCENYHFLRLPEMARKLRVDLWSIGGNNIAAIDRIPNHKIQLPLYYSCDWDQAGLEIYSRVKARLKAKGFNIQLLYPSAAIDKYLPVNSENHKSEWKRDKPYCGLNLSDFSIEDKTLIQQLIKADQWIEEESNDLGLMLERFRSPEE